MQHLYGMGSFEYLAAQPAEAAIFNAAMADATRQIAGAVAAAYDFSVFRSIVDVGGGNGTLLAAILAATPNLRGTVFDLPAGNAEAAPQLAAAGVATRAEVTVGDFFRGVPPDADAYLLKNVVHDWDEDRSTAILLNCRKAMSMEGKLLLVERVMPPRMSASASHQRMALLDMNMLVMPGGRERTEVEYQSLFAAAGLELTLVILLPGANGVCLIEGIPA